jgi:hypothetical protein
MNRWTTIVAAAVIVPMAYVSIAEAQTLEQRISAIRQKEKASRAAKQKLLTSRITMKIGVVNKGKMSAKNALEYLSVISDLPILVNWKQMELAGIDPNMEVQLIGRHLTLGSAIRLVMKQMATDQPLILEPTPHYVQIMTRDQANKNRVIRVYPIGDLLATIPNFTDAPEFDLDSVIAGDPEGGATGGPFDQGAESLEIVTDEEKAQKIVDLIQATVEPEIWGQSASITYWNKSLVVSAPEYVQRQIGGNGPQLSTMPGRPAAAAGQLGAKAPAKGKKVNMAGIAGIDTNKSGPVTKRSPSEQRQLQALFSITSSPSISR